MNRRVVFINKLRGAHSDITLVDIGTVKIGTPARDFHLLMDSGSADLWVGGEGCTSPDDGDCVSLGAKLVSLNGILTFPSYLVTG